MVSRQKYLRQQQSVVRRVSGTAKPLCLTPRRRARKYRLPCPMSSNNQGTSMDDEIYRVLDEELCFGRIKNKSFLGGSSWSSCLLIETDEGHQVFAKIALGKPSSLMFQGEALGLKAMYDTKAMTIPEVYHVGDCPDSSKRGIKGSFILMEYLNFDGRRSTSQRALGEALARMHLTPPSHPKAKEGYFGFDIDNTIGGTPQPNTWEEDWVNFFRTHRLKHQLDLAQDSKLSHLGKILCDNLDVFFPSEVLITPSILHGDLWSGNIASVQGKPSLFDPACYYGHHEAEFGMSWCAGFGMEFWDAYHALVPKQPGFSDRRDVYTLYHYLNHYNLFGGGYHGQCESLLTRLVSKI